MIHERNIFESINYIYFIYVSPQLFYFSFLIGGELLYNVVLASAVHQYELVTGIHMSLLNPPLISHPIPSTSSPTSRLSQTSALSSLGHTANSHLQSVLHMVMYMFPCYSLKSFYPLLPPLFSMSASPLLPCK